MITHRLGWNPEGKLTYPCAKFTTTVPNSVRLTATKSGDSSVSERPEPGGGKQKASKGHIQRAPLAAEFKLAP